VRAGQINRPSMMRREAAGLRWFVPSALALRPPETSTFFPTPRVRHSRSYVFNLRRFHPCKSNDIPLHFAPFGPLTLSSNSPIYRRAGQELIRYAAPAAAPFSCLCPRGQGPLWSQTLFPPSLPNCTFFITSSSPIAEVHLEGVTADPQMG